MSCLILTHLIFGTQYTQAKPSSVLPPLPLLELGAGVAGALFPDYPASAYREKIILPFPVVIYRGDILRATREEGVRGRFINNKWFELDLSFDGTFPVKSRHNPARAGMPNLNAIAEIGPRMMFKLIRSSELLHLDFHLATRGAFSLEFKELSEEGVAFNPFITLTSKHLLGPHSSLSLSAGVKYSSQKLARYYYEVEPQFSTAERPIYHAHSGLMEVSYALGLFTRIPKSPLHLFGGFIYADYQSSANKNSPLYRRSNNASMVLAVSWHFQQVRDF